MEVRLGVVWLLLDGVKQGKFGSSQVTLVHRVKANAHDIIVIGGSIGPALVGLSCLPCGTLVQRINRLRILAVDASCYQLSKFDGRTRTPSSESMHLTAQRAAAASKLMHLALWPLRSARPAKPTMRTVEPTRKDMCMLCCAHKGHARYDRARQCY